MTAIRLNAGVELETYQARLKLQNYEPEGNNRYTRDYLFSERFVAFFDALLSTLICNCGSDETLATKWGIVFNGKKVILLEVIENPVTAVAERIINPPPQQVVEEKKSTEAPKESNTETAVKAIAQKESVPLETPKAPTKREKKVKITTPPRPEEDSKKPSSPRAEEYKANKKSLKNSIGDDLYKEMKTLFNESDRYKLVEYGNTLLKEVQESGKTTQAALPKEDLEEALIAIRALRKNCVEKGFKNIWADTVILKSLVPFAKQAAVKDSKNGLIVLRAFVQVTWLHEYHYEKDRIAQMIRDDQFSLIELRTMLPPENRKRISFARKAFLKPDFEAEDIKALVAALPNKDPSHLNTLISFCNKNLIKEDKPYDLKLIIEKAGSAEKFWKILLLFSPILAKFKNREKAEEFAKLFAWQIILSDDALAIRIRALNSRKKVQLSDIKLT